jgi:hypothetical protein
MNGNPQGDTPLANIFRQDPNAPNILTFALGRADESVSEPLHPGELSIGEVVPGYEAILNTPKLDVALEDPNDMGQQHWSTLLDANGVTVNGQTVQLPTTIINTTADQRQLTVLAFTNT